MTKWSVALVRPGFAEQQSQAKYRERRFSMSCRVKSRERTEKKIILQPKPVVVVWFADFAAENPLERNIMPKADVSVNHSIGIWYGWLL